MYYRKIDCIRSRRANTVFKYEKNYCRIPDDHAYIIIYYIPTHDMPKIWPYFFNQIQLQFRITHVPCATENVNTVWRGTSRVYYWILLIWNEANVYVALLCMLRFLHELFPLIYDVNFTLLSIWIWVYDVTLLDVTNGTSFSRKLKFVCSTYAMYMPIFIRNAQFSCVIALTYKIVRVYSAIIKLIS